MQREIAVSRFKADGVCFAVDESKREGIEQAQLQRWDRLLSRISASAKCVCSCLNGMPNLALVCMLVPVCAAGHGGRQDHYLLSWNTGVAQGRRLFPIWWGEHG